jgi:hypothetical protein
MANEDMNFDIHAFNKLVDAAIAAEEAKVNSVEETDESGQFEAAAAVAEEENVPTIEVIADSVAASEPKVVTKNTDRDIVGRIGKNLVVLTNNANGVEIVCYGSAAVAAKHEGIHATTVRTRCAKEDIDNKNRKWTYE